MQRVLIAIAVVSSLAAHASAQPRADRRERAEPAPDTTVYRFDDELVTGDVVRPDDGRVVVRRRNANTSLVEVRTQFVDELLESVEDL